MDFSLSTKRLESQQKKSREDAKRKLHQEKQAQERQKAREAYAAIQRAEKAERDRVAAEEEVRRLEREIALTGGITFEQTYVATFKDDLEEDKVILPESALGSLSSQDAMGNGVMLFTVSRLDAAGSVVSTTHCGVREFSAPEDTIILSRKVIDSLSTNEETQNRTNPLDNVLRIRIKYVRMNKLEYIKLQPIDNRFSTIIPVKNMLTDNLIKHATLTKGDILTVWYRGDEHRLRVVDTKPDDHGCLIDTNVEVDLDVSEEYLKKQEQAAISSSESSSSSSNTNTNTNFPPTTSIMNTGKGYSLGSSVNPSTLPSASAASSSTGSIATHKFEEEPAKDATGVIMCKIKTPSGQLLVRRFLRDHKFESLFYYSSERLTEAGVQESRPERITLATRFPSKVYTMNETEGGKTFEDFGITESQQVFLLSVI